MLLISLSVGYYFKNSGDHELGNKIVGITVFAGAFLFMPVFLKHRWQGKKLKDYTLTQKNFDKIRSKQQKK
jgi:ribosomal protein S19